METFDNNRILIIDDNPAIHNDFNKILGAKDSSESDATADLFLGITAETTGGPEYSLSSAFQGQEGVELAKTAIDERSPFALAFVDMRMPPGWDGLKTIQELWKVDQDLQVVLCTAYSDHSWRDLQEALGRSEKLLILKKPFDSTEVSQLAVALSEKWRLQKELETALETALSANKAKSNFVATMSHELRTPLNGVLGMTRLLAETELTERQRSLLEACQTSGESLLHVIGSILDFSKIEAGRMELELEATSLMDLIEGVTQSIGSAKRNVDLNCLIDPEIPAQVYADPAKLRQLIFNLAGNAVKFTNEGSISIAAKCVERTDDEVTVNFSVEDTGIGIPQEQLVSIFDTFSQVDNSATRNYDGAGLGLAICREFVRLMGGEITVRSEEGVGSLFQFALTFKTSNDVVRKEWQIPAGLKIATVGVGEATHKMIAEMLQSYDAECQRVFCLRDDDPIPDLTPFDILLLNYNGDGASAELATNKIKSASRNQELKIVPVCNIGYQVPEESVCELGLQRALLKPVCQSRLCELLQSICGNEISDPVEPAAEVRIGLESNLKPKVLLVEDNEINQLFAENIFEMAGFEHEICCNGQEAIDRIAKNDDFDIILMDCQMPVMDGLEASRIINDWVAEERIKKIPIVALTANAVSNAKEECLDAGMVDYLTKPFDMDELFSVIDRCIQLDQ